MKHSLCLLLAVGLTALAQSALATQADDTTITITAQTAGVTPFIEQLTLQASDTTVIKSVQFTIAPKPGSVTRALSGIYVNSYLTSRGYLQPGGQIFLPVYGLYASFANTVTLTYDFNDGSSKTDTTTITTPAYSNTCTLDTPTVLLARTGDTTLSYDFMFVRGACPGSPIMMDTDGQIRWVSPMGTNDMTQASSGFFDNAVYITNGPELIREDLDGTVTTIADYTSLGVTGFHHNIDRGKTGILLDADTTGYKESVVLEVDGAGTVLKVFNLAQVISAAMIAGGDDPTQFVFPAPTDWFHNNAVTYRRSDDRLIVSSRENFVIALDYETSTIKWIFGDETKHWFQFPSLQAFALTASADTVVPVGQHGLSITLDNNLLLMDNGYFSTVQMPPGMLQSVSLPRKYRLDLANNTATELFEYPGTETVFSAFCGSAYEDAKDNYVVDYAYIQNSTGADSQLLGFDAAGAQVFGYQFPGGVCDTAYGTLPVHLESTRFPRVGPQALNLSTRALVGPGDHALIAGFIITGATSKTVVLRGLGPSLASAGVSGALSDPVLSLYDSAGNLISTNDDFGTDADTNGAVLESNHLTPTDPAESALVQTLAPGTYTVVLSGKGAATGVGLVEAYDLSPTADSRLANLSARGNVGTGDGALISGLIVGDVDKATVVVRALGPSLPTTDVGQPLSDPSLTVFDSNGTAIENNDNWQDGDDAADIAADGLAPGNAAEAAILVNLPAGSYTAVVQGANGGTGVALAEFYNLH